MKILGNIYPESYKKAYNMASYYSKASKLSNEDSAELFKCMMSENSDLYLDFLCQDETKEAIDEAMIRTTTNELGKKLLAAALKHYSDTIEEIFDEAMEEFQHDMHEDRKYGLDIDLYEYQTLRSL